MTVAGHLPSPLVTHHSVPAPGGPLQELCGPPCATGVSGEGRLSKYSKEDKCDSRFGLLLFEVNSSDLGPEYMASFIGLFWVSRLSSLSTKLCHLKNTIDNLFFKGRFST